ncbi:MAG: hypothetical protein IH940_07950 [Acidobacteria bacterium]|nr:hypothetical protein [Acidobacteriota bacterium]
MGRSRLWMGVLGLGALTKAISKVSKSGPGPILFSESLAEGAAIEIVHLDPLPTRRQRRKARKAQR